MKIKLIIYLSIFFLCGAAIGLWVGQSSPPNSLDNAHCRPVKAGELDSFYTDVLGVTDSQKAEILEIEKQYQKSRDYFARRMHKANMDLAKVIEEEGYESTQIASTVEEIHTAMGELQKLSLSHLAAVEKRLKPDQALLLKKSAIARLRQN